MKILSRTLLIIRVFLFFSSILINAQFGPRYYVSGYVYYRSGSVVSDIQVICKVFERKSRGNNYIIELLETLETHTSPFGSYKFKIDGYNVFNQNFYFEVQAIEGKYELASMFL